MDTPLAALIKLVQTVAVLVGCAWLLDRVLRTVTDAQTTAASQTIEALTTSTERLTDLVSQTAAGARAYPTVDPERTAVDTDQNVAFAAYPEQVRHIPPYDPGNDPTDLYVTESDDQYAPSRGRVATVAPGSIPNGDLVALFKSGGFPTPTGMAAPNLDAE